MDSENTARRLNDSFEQDFSVHRLVRMSVLTGADKELDSLFGDLRTAVLVSDSEFKLVYLNNSSHSLITEQNYQASVGSMLMDYVKKILEPSQLITFYEALLGRKNATFHTGFINPRIKSLLLNAVGSDGYILKLNIDELFTESASNLFRYFPGMPVTFFGFDLSAGKRLSIRFVGDNFSTLFPEIDTDELLSSDNKFIQYIHPDDLPGFLAQLQNLKRKKNSFTAEFRFVSGENIRWYNMYAARYVEDNNENFWLAYLEDKTERKQHLLEKEALVYETLDSERQRIAMELHDNLGQNLVALNLFLSSLETSQTSDQFLVCRNLVLDSITKMKSLCYNLTPPELEKGLLMALDSFFGKVGELSKDIRYEFSAKNIDLSRIGHQRTYNIFRIVQEFVSNSQKYSECTEVTCELFSKANRIVLVLKDDGKGFDVENAKRGFGLNNMFKRAKVAEAEVELMSNEKEGTCLILQFSAT